MPTLSFIWKSLTSGATSKSELPLGKDYLEAFNVLIKCKYILHTAAPTSLSCVVIYFLSLLRQGDNTEAPIPSLGFQRDLYQYSTLVLHCPAGGAGVGDWLASRQCGGGLCRASQETNPSGLSLLFPLVSK